MTTDIHSCSLHCDRPGCIKAQRDQMRDEFAHPQVPLTQDEIVGMAENYREHRWRWYLVNVLELEQFVRAIEAHFGIGEKE